METRTACFCGAFYEVVVCSSASDRAEAQLGLQWLMKFNRNTLCIILPSHHGILLCGVLKLGSLQRISMVVENNLVNVFLPNVERETVFQVRRRGPGGTRRRGRRAAFPLHRGLHDGEHDVPPEEVLAACFPCIFYRPVFSLWAVLCFALRGCKFRNPFYPKVGSFEVVSSATPFTPKLERFLRAI